MTIDLSMLFESSGEPSKYESIEEELEAVATGSKAMSVFVSPCTSVETSPLYLRLREIALRLNLSIVISGRNEGDPDPSLRMADVFLAKSTELWRVQAYSAFKKSFEPYDWSDAAEHFESMLLGYSDEDISKWLHIHSRLEIGWTGRAFYLLLPSLGATDVRSHAKRYLDAETIVEPITVFFNRKRSLLLESADRLLPDGLVLARVSVNQSFFRRLFGRRSTSDEADIVASLLTSERAAEMNSALASNFQFLEAGAWN